MTGGARSSRDDDPPEPAESRPRPSPVSAGKQVRPRPCQDHGGDLNKIGKNEDLIEQVPLELLEVRHHILPDESASITASQAVAVQPPSDPGWRSEYENSMLSSVPGGFS